MAAKAKVSRHAGDAASDLDGPVQRSFGLCVHSAIVDKSPIFASRFINSIGVVSIHKRIRAGRERLGLNEQQFADRLGVTRAAVQFWEREGPRGTAPSRKLLPSVATALGMTVSELVSGETAVGTTLSPEAHMLGAWLDRVTGERNRSQAYVAAMQSIVEFLPGHDLPPTEPHTEAESEEKPPAARQSRQARR